MITPSNTMAQAYLSQLHFLEKFAIKLYERGDTDQAKKEFQRILRIDPKNATAKQYLDQINKGTAPAVSSKARTPVDKANSIANDIQSLKKDLTENAREVSMLESIIRNLITENDQIYVALNKRSREVMELREKVYGLTRAAQQKKFMQENPPDRIPQNLHRADEILPGQYTGSADAEIGTVATRLGKATDGLHAITNDIEESKKDLEAIIAKGAKEKEQAAYADLLDDKRATLVEKNAALADKKEKLSSLKGDVSSINQNLKSAHYRYVELIDKIDQYYKDIKAQITSNYEADQKMIGELVADYSKQTAELEALKQNMQKDMASAEAAAQKRYDELMSRYKALNDELEKQKQTLATATEATKAAEKTVADKAASEQTAQKRYDQLLADFKTKSQEVDALKQQNADSAAAEKNYQELTASLKAQIAELETTKGKLQAEADASKASADASKAATDQAKAETAAAISAAQKQYDELLGQFKTKSRELETWKYNNHPSTAKHAAEAANPSSPEEMQKRYDELLSQFKAKANELATLKRNERAKAFDQKRFNDLMASYDSKVSELANLQKNIAKRDAELASYKVPLAEAEAKIQALNAALETKDKQIAEFRSQLSNANSALSVVDSQVNNIQNLLKEGDAEMANLSNNIAKMKTKNLARKENLKASVEKDATITALQQKLADNAKQILDLKNSLDTKSQALLSLEERINRKEDETRKLRDDLQIQTKAAAAKPDPVLLENLTNEQSKLRANLLQRDQQLMDTAKDLTNTKSEIARLLQALEDTQKQLTEEVNQREAKEKDLAKLASQIQQQKNSHTQDMTAAKQETEKTRRELQAQELDLKEKELAFAESKEALKKLTDSLLEAQNQVKVLEERLVFLEGKQQSLRTVADQRDADLAKLNAELDASRNSLQAAQKEIASLTNKNKNSQAAVARAVIKLQDSALKNAQTTKQIEQMRSDLQAAHNALKNMHKDVESFARSKGSLDKRETIIRDLQKELEQQCATIYYQDGTDGDKDKTTGCTMKKSTKDKPATNE